MWNITISHDVGIKWSPLPSGYDYLHVHNMQIANLVTYKLLYISLTALAHSYNAPVLIIDQNIGWEP